MTDEARFFKNSFGGPNLGQLGQFWAQNLFFSHFFKFGLLVVLEIAKDDTLKHCLTTSRGKTHGENFGAPNWMQN